MCNLTEVGDFRSVQTRTVQITANAKTANKKTLSGLVRPKRAANDTNVIRVARPLRRPKEPFSIDDGHQRQRFWTRWLSLLRGTGLVV